MLRKHNLISALSKHGFSSNSYPFTSFPPTPPISKSLTPNDHLTHTLLEMAKQGLNMNFHAYDTLLNECVKQKAVRGGQRVHAHMIKTRYQPSVYLRTRLIVLYTKCELLRDALQVLDEMPERNVVSWTTMISGYCRSGYASEALNLFVEMLRSGTEPNEFTFATVLTACTGTSGFDCGRQIHNLIIKSNFDSHIYVGSSLLDMYAKSSSIHDARSVFESLPERDVVSCTAIISGYAQLGLDEEALELFCRLQREGMACNYVTYASVLTTLSGVAAFEHGRQVHAHSLRSELQCNAVLQNSLIDMYSKCGQLTYSRTVFEGMLERTVISWNAMLVGYSKHGMGKEVLELFKLLREENTVRPDKVTYLAVLSGVEHTGLKVFDEMVSGKDVVEPNIEHYGCVVDMLGRSGQVEEALNFVRQMPIGPTAAIWGSLLGACRLHASVDVGEFVGKQLLEIEPENSGIM